MLLDHPSDGLTAIRTHIGAIFVSLELSRSNWLVTSLSPGKGEKMSKHSITAGDIAGLLALFAELKRKAAIRTGQSYPIITLQEAGLDGFWLHRVLQQEGIESHVVDPASIATPRRRRRAKTDRLDGEALLRALLAYKRGDRRARLEALRTGDGRELPSHLKAQIGRELDRIELLLGQIKAVEAAQDALLAAARKPASEEAAPDPVTMLLALRGWVRTSPPCSGRRRSIGSSPTAARSPPMRALRQRPGKAEASGTSRACRRPAIPGCGPR